VSEGKRTLKQRAFRESGSTSRSHSTFSLFSPCLPSIAMLLAEHNAPHGFALINALALAKVILIAQDLGR